MTTALTGTDIQAVQTALTELISRLKSHQPHGTDTTPIGQVEIYTATVDGGCRDLLGFYRDDIDSHSFYWRNRERTDEIVAYGVACLSSDTDILEQPSERWLCVAPFEWNAQRSGVLPRIFLPKIELTRSGERAQIICRIAPDNGVARLECIENLAALREDITSVDQAVRIVARRDSPDREGWEAMIRQAHRSIRHHEFRKVVLARVSELTLDQELSIAQLVRELSHTEDGSYLMSLTDPWDGAFISVSPERLYHREGNCIHTEAVAGTRPRGRTIELDAQFRDELLQSAKDREEHAIVRDMLNDSLEELTLEHSEEISQSIVALATVQHLRVKLSGTLRATTTDAQILSSLHPTPAVGGAPSESARQFIRSHEPFTRHWYAGAIGFAGPETAEFAVGIRSARLQGTHLTLFAGAGIVERSEPNDEWRELEQKIQLWLDLLGHSPHADR